MVKNIFWKSLIIVIVILFIGANIIPIVNSKNIKQMENNNQNPGPGELWFKMLCHFNVTFYGPCMRHNPLTLGPFIIWQRLISLTPPVNPTATITYVSNGEWESLEIPDRLYLHAFFCYSL